MRWIIPDGLVGDDDLVPLLLAQLLGDSVELAGNDLDGLVGLTLLQKVGCEWITFFKLIAGLSPVTHYRDRDENEKPGGDDVPQGSLQCRG
jgi:hypothetical protein